MVTQTDIEPLLESQRPMMLSYAKTILGKHAMHAEDIVQEASITAFNNFERFDEHKGSFGSWVRGITRFKCLNRLRKSDVRSEASFEGVVEGIEEVYSMFDEPDENKNWRDRLELIWQCTGKLTDTMKTVVELYYVSGFTIKEIAKKKSIKLPTAGQRLNRGREAIRKCVEIQLRKESYER